MSRHTGYIYTSLLSILLMTLHVTDDVIRNELGAQGGLGGIVVVLILVVWLYGLLRLTERKSGYIISLVGALGLSFIAVGHLTGIGGEEVPAEILAGSGPFYVWVIFTLGVTAVSSLVFSAYLLFTPAE